MILVLGGTTEGREMAQALINEGYSCLLSVAGDLGRQLVDSKIPCQVGALEPVSLEKLIREEGIRLIIDATHPYALQIKEISRIASGKLQIEYWRLERPQTKLPEHANLYRVSDYARALCMLSASQGGILFTIGTRKLAVFRKLWEEDARPVWAKVYPEADSMLACREAGLRPDQIFAFHGSGSAPLLAEILHQTGAAWLVTKDSGSNGGTDMKVQLGLEMGQRVLVIDRPAASDGLVFESMEQVITTIRNRSDLY